MNLSILVVDNGSAPAERERLVREAPAARLVPFPRNLGFAGAVNEGIARTRSPFVLLLNNDATLDPDYTARLTARLALDERLAAAQGLVLTADGSRVDTAGIAWTDSQSPDFRFTREANNVPANCTNETTNSGFNKPCAERVPVFSTGVSFRFNLLGYMILETYVAKPFQRPAKGWVLGLHIAPGW